MSRVEAVKAGITYMELWMGVLIAADISLPGWFASNYESASAALEGLAIAAVFGLSAAIALLHHRIRARIKYLEDI